MYLVLRRVTNSSSIPFAGVTNGLPSTSAMRIIAYRHLTTLVIGLALVVFTSYQSLAQTQRRPPVKYASMDPRYIKAVQLADTSIAKGQWIEAAAHLETALAITEKSQRTLLRYAEVCYQLARYDVMYSNLLKARNRNWQLFCSWLIDQKEQFIKVNTDPTWKRLETDCQERVEAYYKGLDSVYIDSLKLLREQDERYRYDLERLIAQEGATSAAVVQALEVQDSLDQDNRIRFEALLKAKGFPSLTKTGLVGSQTGLIILQRAPVAMRLKWKPSLDSLLAKEEIRRPDYAVFVDNLLISQKKSQRYGTQVRPDVNGIIRLHPVENPNKVDSLRLDMNLGSLADYLSKLGVANPYANTKKKTPGKPVKKSAPTKAPAKAHQKGLKPYQTSQKASK